MPRSKVFKMTNLLLASRFRCFGCNCVCVCVCLGKTTFQSRQCRFMAPDGQRIDSSPRYDCGLAINILLFTFFLQFQVFHCMYRVLTEAHTKEQRVIVSLPI